MYEVELSCSLVLSDFPFFSPVVPIFIRGHLFNCLYSNE